MREDSWKVREYVPIGTINLEDSSDVTRRIAEEVILYIQRNKNQEDGINPEQVRGGYLIKLVYGYGRVNKKLQEGILNKFKKYHICHIGTCDAPLTDIFMIRSDLLATIHVTHTFLWDFVLWVKKSLILSNSLLINSLK